MSTFRILAEEKEFCQFVRMMNLTIKVVSHCGAITFI